VYGTTRALDTGVVFRNRSDAGRQLAELLVRHRDEHPLVLGLPRGGVVVAFEVARALGAPLDVWIARKIGAPGRPELGIGAISEGGELFLDDEMMRAVGATEEIVAHTIRQEAAEVERRARAFRKERPAPDVKGRTVIVVDDGIATGGTARAAVRSLRRHGAGRVVLAVPVAGVEAAHDLSPEVDELVCLQVPAGLGAVGQFYLDFAQTGDEEVTALLDRARLDFAAGARGAYPERRLPWR
jgi:putative phosphoribosyl transferase